MFPPLYVVLDQDLLRVPSCDCAESLAGAGVVLIQYRAKHSAAREYLESCSMLVARLAASSARLIVNDRPDIAAIVGAGGVHVGQEDLPPDEARRICGPKRWVGVSTHNLEHVRAANLTSVDYIAVGPIFATPTKEKLDPLVGTAFIRQARQFTRKPIVAIGGITLERVAEVYKAGADCVAVARDILSASDPGVRAKEFLAVAGSSLRN
ncbi:MAG TPA: thiamine phosphate synthase [Candidatus Acidoferrales bacterium]|nr:thiamine phosphate synthase [Candidatus Acidoferrales bacterium]